MRPRNLLRLVNYAKGNAVNLGHTKITAEDLRKASGTFSADIVKEISLEITDVFPPAEDLLYAFIGMPPRLTDTEVREVLRQTALIPREYDRVVEALLWFAFFRIARHTPEETELYIYDAYYDMKKLMRSY